MRSVHETITLIEKLIGRNNGSFSVGSVNAYFIAPTFHIDVVSESFCNRDLEGRSSILQEAINTLEPRDPALIATISARLPVSINLLTPDEHEDRATWIDTASASASWVAQFLPNIGFRSENHHAESGLNFTHFYGYKGGQARSSVLALLAKHLADDGYKVLVVDADLEAPSLDLLFDASATLYSQSVMGLCGWADSVQPIAGAYVGRSEGRVDILPCKPRIDNVDLDFALLVATAPLGDRIYKLSAQVLTAYLRSLDEPYDLIMVDHRTGITSSVLPLITHLPGAVAIFARTDSNTAAIPSELLGVVRAIFNKSASSTGAFLSFSLDPNKKTSGQLAPEEARVRERLLEELLPVVDRDGYFSTDELALNWIEWYLDRALLRATLPDVSDLQGDNIRALGSLRSALNLPIGPKKSETRKDPSPLLQPVSLSGARDSGQFIHIPEVERLFIKDSPYTYVLGRKGTGKTRLLRELANRGLGSPTLVAADDRDSMLAIRSQSVECEEWLSFCENDAGDFWWSLLSVALAREDRETMFEAFERLRAERRVISAIAGRVTVKRAIELTASPLTLLIDGLETLVAASRIKVFTASLLDMMSTIQNDTELATKIVIRAFIRQDLVGDSIQNLEQQIEGRSLRLKWSLESTLNFAVSRLPMLPWISTNFSSVIDDIKSRWVDVQRSKLDESEATSLLLKIFPDRLRRNNLSTVTFLRLYFSDAGGDDTNRATFYPRLYLSFLQKLDALSAVSKNPLDPAGHIDSALLNAAYDEASTEFISETKQELIHLLSLDYSTAVDEDDGTKVTKFLSSFAGLSTPFLLDDVIEQLNSKTGFTERSIRDALGRMKSIRMFEDRPGYAGWWRVGQLYKNGLSMKYVRSSIVKAK